MATFPSDRLPGEKDPTTRAFDVAPAFPDSNPPSEVYDYSFQLGQLFSPPFSTALRAVELQDKSCVPWWMKPILAERCCCIGPAISWTSRPGNTREVKLVTFCTRRQRGCPLPGHTLLEVGRFARKVQRILGLNLTCKIILTYHIGCRTENGFSKGMCAVDDNLCRILQCSCLSP